MPQKIDKQHTKSFAHMFPFPYLFVKSSDLTFLCFAFPLVHTFFMFQSFCFLSLVTKYILFFSLPSCHQENHNDGFHTFAKIVANGHILLNTPDFFQPPKLSRRESVQYWPRGLAGKCLGCCRLCSFVPS